MKIDYTESSYWGSRFGEKQLQESSLALQSKKQSIILERIKAVTGEDFDIEKEKTRRFKRLLFEVSENQETVYLDDGTPDGLRIVTFNSVTASSDDGYVFTLTQEYY